NAPHRSGAYAMRQLHERMLPSPNFGSGAALPRLSHSPSPSASILVMCAPGELGRAANGPTRLTASSFFGGFVSSADTITVEALAKMNSVAQVAATAIFIFIE